MSTSSAVDTKNIITLKGSVAIVSDFFFCAINSILYQRGIYEPENFNKESKYGLTVLTTTHQGLLAYLKQVMSQMNHWLVDGNVQRLVVVVTGVDSGETLERWQFNISVDNDTGTSGKELKEANGDIVMGGTSAVVIGDENIPAPHNGVKPKTTTKKAKASRKSMAEIHKEIQAIIRQITASVTFLPLLNEPCSFDLLVYTDNEATVPQKWEDSDPRYILKSQEVKLRSFTTSVHKVESMVTYKEKDEWEL
mmetsp:Transcript_11049/g.13071  ORF Transcript_11049/g.13071 Transcript_11049/m.13071 type:complete len:251 (-) Transcript_11049:204-956(-)|eukprot:CAMPEP_0198255830 /NCGR_PEP_ID=MMETSP1447-20131203/5882_1 /TAXON_ID=420782 /ORGANISM="Chaetoceros dichaeta, Strain CCMP1751" /LENGTH=250 /DNA_ID=CAMNT_0043942311 /DNA_START=105 /DNA_END=857 /DNA_ORIENTATION=-